MSASNVEVAECGVAVCSIALVAWKLAAYSPATQGEQLQCASTHASATHAPISPSCTEGLPTPATACAKLFVLQGVSSRTWRTKKGPSACNEVMAGCVCVAELCIVTCELWSNAHHALSASTHIRNAVINSKLAVTCRYKQLLHTARDRQQQALSSCHR
ncbi:hypothetical protein C0Q70_16213 [Pomacea canaliculata]|uniref:Uncharacterized protein n=1 Tax=Pomacea canaliculata TaxID=400727 RepID=A0A2T7NP76_POMCA|nr:hypothetical protein C0Q70_16213 [Pomacea canaliculata]